MVVQELNATLDWNNIEKYLDFLSALTYIMKPGYLKTLWFKIIWE